MGTESPVLMIIEPLAFMFGQSPMLAEWLIIVSRLPIQELYTFHYP